MNAYYYYMEWDEGDKTRWSRGIILANSPDQVCNVVIGDTNEVYGREILKVTHPVEINLIEKEMKDEGLCLGQAEKSRIYYHKNGESFERTTAPTLADRMYSWGMFGFRWEAEEKRTDEER